MHRVSMSAAVLHDYESRGLLHEIGDDLRVTGRAGLTVTVEATGAVLRMMIDDCVYRIECHDLERTEVRSLLRFIEKAGAALEEVQA